MNKRNKERGGLYDANNIRTELYFIIEDLIYFQKEPKLLNKYEMSLSDKNDFIEQEIKQVIKSLTKLSEKDIKNGKDINIVNDFLRESRRKRSNRKYVEKKSKSEVVKSMRESMIDFVKNHLTVNEL